MQRPKLDLCQTSATQGHLGKFCSGNEGRPSDQAAALGKSRKRRILTKETSMPRRALQSGGRHATKYAALILQRIRNDWRKLKCAICQRKDLSVMPRVSVVMTAYNDLRFLDEAVASILCQDFPNLELIIVDDGTGEEEAFARQAARDMRVRIVVNDRNLGAAEAANRGIMQAEGEIIARLDADDIAEPTRISTLVAALDADADLGLVGSWYTTIEEDGNKRELIKTPESDCEIRWAFLFYNPFCHSSVAFRRSCFHAAKGYDQAHRLSIDYDLYSRMLPLCRVGNIPEPLVQYRLNPLGLTTTHALGSRARAYAIREKCWRDLGIECGHRDEMFVSNLAQFVSGYEISNPRERPELYRLVLVMLRAFLASSPPNFRGADQGVARRLSGDIVGRVLSDPAVGLRATIEFARLCWPFQRSAAIAAICYLLVHAGLGKISAAKQRIVGLMS